MRELIEYGADLDLARLDGATPLYTAAKENKLDCVWALIYGGANVNSATNSGTTALYVAAYKGNHHVVRALIAGQAVVVSSRHISTVPVASKHPLSLPPRPSSLLPPHF